MTRQRRERAEHPCDWQRCGAGELRGPHLPFSMKLQADHFVRRLSNNHSRPIAATINTTTTDHGVDEVGSSLVTDGFASDEVGSSLVTDGFASDEIGTGNGFTLGKLLAGKVRGALTAADLRGIILASSASMAARTSLPLSEA